MIESGGYNNKSYRKLLVIRCFIITISSHRRVVSSSSVVSAVHRLRFILVVCNGAVRYRHWQRPKVCLASSRLLMTVPGHDDPT